MYSRLPVSSTKGRKIGTIVFSRAGAKYHDCSTIEKTDFTCMLVSKQLSVASLFNYKPDVPETPAYAKVRYSERFCIVGPQDMQIGGRPLIVVCVYCIPRNILDNSYSNGSLLCQHFFLEMILNGIVRTVDLGHCLLYGIVRKVEIGDYELQLSQGLLSSVVYELELSEQLLSETVY